MSMFHPGDHALTDRAVELCGFRAGELLLDLGCGEGETLSYLRDHYDIRGEGCDLDQPIIDRALARDPALKIQLTSGDELDFPSLYFDGALAECSFSLMSRHEELLHELFCVLKPGGRLAISDLYVREPDPQKVRAAKEAALAELRRPSQNQDCQTRSFPSPCLLEGVFVRESLEELLTETGFTLLAFEDKTPELRDYVAQLLMEYGSLEKYWQQMLPPASEGCRYCRPHYGSDTGYFLLVAEKPRK